MKLILTLYKLIGRLWNLMIFKKILSKVFPYAIWKIVLKILNFSHSRRRAILDPERTPSFEKQSTRFFFFFFFLNMHILKIISSWRSCPLSIGWMAGLLGFGPWGNWKSLGGHASSSQLFIKGNLRAYAPLVGQRDFFLLFDFLTFFFKWKM